MSYGSTWVDSNDLRLVSPRRLAMPADSYVDFDGRIGKAKCRIATLNQLRAIFASFCGFVIHNSGCIDRTLRMEFLQVAGGEMWGVYHVLTLKRTDLVRYLTWLWRQFNSLGFLLTQLLCANHFF